MKAIQCDCCGEFAKRGCELKTSEYLNFLPVGRNSIKGEIDLCPKCWQTIESVILRMFKQGKPCEFILME